MRKFPPLLDQANLGVTNLGVRSRNAPELQCCKLWGAHSGGAIRSPICAAITVPTAEILRRETSRATGSVPTIDHVLHFRIEIWKFLTSRRPAGRESWSVHTPRALGARSCRYAAAVGRFGEGGPCKARPSNLTASVRKCKNRPVGGFCVFLAEAVRFELTNSLTRRQFSRLLPSTTRPRFLSGGIIQNLPAL